MPNQPSSINIAFRQVRDVDNAISNRVIEKISLGWFPLLICFAMRFAWMYLYESFARSCSSSWFLWKATISARVLCDGGALEGGTCHWATVCCLWIILWGNTIRVLIYGQSCCGQLTGCTKTCTNTTDSSISGKRNGRFADSKVKWFAWMLGAMMRMCLGWWPATSPSSPARN